MKYVSASFNLLLSVVWLGRIRRIIWYSIWICTDLTYLKYWLYRFSISILLLMEELTFCVGFPFLRFTLVLTIIFLLKDIYVMPVLRCIHRTCKYVYFRKRYIEGHTITCIIQPNRWWKNNFLILMVLMSGYIVLGTSVGVGTKRYGHELTVAS